MFAKTNVTHCLFDMDGLLLGECRICSLILKFSIGFVVEENWLDFFHLTILTPALSFIPFQTPSQFTRASSAILPSSTGNRIYTKFACASWEPPSKWWPKSLLPIWAYRLRPPNSTASSRSSAVSASVIWSWWKVPNVCSCICTNAMCQWRWPRAPA